MFYGYEEEVHLPITGGELKGGLKLDDDIDMSLNQIEYVAAENDPGK